MSDPNCGLAEVLSTADCAVERELELIESLGESRVRRVYKMLTESAVINHAQRATEGAGPTPAGDKGAATGLGAPLGMFEDLCSVRALILKADPP
jgi:hypothetical protein